jgi:hypothetical protein
MAAQVKTGVDKVRARDRASRGGVPDRRPGLIGDDEAPLRLER